MTFEEATREAALAANAAVARAMNKYASRRVKHEDDLTGILIGQLDAALEGEIGGLSWDASILSHRSGKAAEESKIGADLLIHVTMDTPTQTYSKGVLVQAKRLEPDQSMSGRDHGELINQCKRMLKYTPAAFVFNYAKGSMRCGPATKIAGSSMACTRFRRHRVRCFNGTGGWSWRDGSLRKSSSLRRCA